jgi:hypothetical protein
MSIDISNSESVRLMAKEAGDPTTLEHACERATFRARSYRQRAETSSSTAQKKRYLRMAQAHEFAARLLGQLKRSLATASPKSG